MAKMEKEVVDLTVDSSAESEHSKTNLEDTAVIDDSLWESSTEGSSDEDFETSSKCSK